MQLVKGIRGLARAILFGFVMLAFLFPPLALFSPYVLVQLFELMNVPAVPNRLNFFIVLPLLLLITGLALWYLLEAVSLALEKQKSG